MKLEIDVPDATLSALRQTPRELSTCLGLTCEVSQAGAAFAMKFQGDQHPAQRNSLLLHAT
jgi:hypothetical protein